MRWSAGVPLSTHTEELRHQSGLCAQLAEVYRGLKEAGMANLTINDDIDMAVMLHSELFQASSLSAPLAQNSRNGSMFFDSPWDTRYHSRMRLHKSSRQAYNPYEQYSSGTGLNRLTNRLTDGLLEGPSLSLSIMPWQSLLPMKDPEEFLEDIDDDGLLSRFLEIMSPRWAISLCGPVSQEGPEADKLPGAIALSLTFTEYETLLDTDSQSIMEIAEHLIYWRKAKLIDTISLKSIYGPIRPSQPGANRL